MLNFSLLEMQAALQAMRARAAFSAWPDDLQAVMSDPVRARLVRLEATGRRTQRANINTPASTPPARWRGPKRAAAPVQSVDLKSRAAGDDNSNE